MRAAITTISRLSTALLVAVRCAFLTLLLGVLNASVIAQSPARALERIDREGVVSISIVDRYRLPVRSVHVCVVAISIGMAPHSDIWFGSHVGHDNCFESDEGGMLSLPAIAGTYLVVDLNKSGYAPLRSYWLFGGWHYELVLHIGAVASFAVIDSVGQPVADANILVMHRESTVSPWRRLSIAALRSDSDGRVELAFMPNGEYLCISRSNGHSAGVTAFQVCNQFGHEAVPSLSDIPIEHRATWAYAANVVNENGESIPGVRVSIGSRFRRLSDEIALVSTNGAAVEIRGIPDQIMKEGVVLIVGAPGYQSREIRSDCLVPDALLSGLSTNQLVLESSACRTLTFKAEPAFFASTAVYVPSVFGVRGPLMQVLPDRAGLIEITQVPAETKVVGLLIQKAQISGYLIVSLDGTSLQVCLPARVNLRFSVDGHRPQHLICVAGRHESRQYRADINFAEVVDFPTFISDPAGAVDCRTLFPGVYRLDPHIHQTVYSDALIDFEAAEARDVEVEIGIRRGVPLKGSLVVPGGAVAPRFGYMELQAERVPLHFQLSPVGEDGAFAFDGLTPGITFSLRYYPVPWYANWNRFKLPSGAVHPGIVVGQFVPPMPGIVTVKVPNDPFTHSENQ